MKLLEYKEIAQRAVGMHVATTGPFYEDDEELEFAYFTILDTDGPLHVLVASPLAFKRALMAWAGSEIDSEESGV